MTARGGVLVAAAATLAVLVAGALPAFASTPGWEAKTDDYPADHPAIHVDSLTVTSEVPDAMTVVVRVDSFCLSGGTSCWTGSVDVDFRLNCTKTQLLAEDRTAADEWANDTERVQAQTRGTVTQPGGSVTISTSCPTTHPYASFVDVIVVWGTAAREQYYARAGSLWGGSGSSVDCPGELWHRGWAAWDGTSLTALGKWDEQAWRSFTLANAAQSWAEQPQPTDWEVWLADPGEDEGRTWADLPTTGVALAFDDVRTGTGPDGSWTGAWQRPWARDPSIVDDLDGDGIAESYVYLVPAGSDNGANPPCGLHLEVRAMDAGTEPADTSTLLEVTTPPSSTTPGGEPVAPGSGSERDVSSGCGLTNLLGCARAVVVPSPGMLQRVEVARGDFGDIVPFGWAIDGATWLDEVATAECSDGAAPSWSGVPGVAGCDRHIAFDVPMPPTGEVHELVLLSDRTGLNDEGHPCTSGASTTLSSCRTVGMGLLAQARPFIGALIWTALIWAIAMHVASMATPTASGDS